MPKIPLYARGMGSQVDLATGSLGPSAPTEAFAAPGQAMARAGQAIGQTGRQFAKNMMEFDNASKDLEFKFQKAQKDEETKTLSQKFAAQAYTQADTYTLETKEPNMEKMVTGLTNTVQTPILNEIKGLNLTPSQTEAITGSVLQTMKFKVADAKKVSFQYSQSEKSAASNATLENALAEISKTDNSSDFNAIVATNLAVIDDGRQNQLSLNYGRKTFLAEAQTRFFSGKVDALQNFANAEVLKSTVAASSEFASESIKQGILSSIDTKIRELEEGKEDEVRDVLLGANLTGDEEAQALAQMRDVDAGFVTIEREDETISIDLRGTGAKFRTALANQFEQGFKTSQADANKKLIDTLYPTIAGMDRNELNAFIDEAETLTGRFSGYGRNVAEPLISNAEQQLAVLDETLTASIRADTDALETILVANEGRTPPNAQPLIDSVSKKLSQLENPVPGQLFDEAMTGTRNAGVLFSSVKFGTPSEIAAARVALQKEKAEATTTEGARIAGIKSDRFEEMLALRQSKITDDPVKFIQDDLQVKGQDAASIDQLISLQKQMGIADVDIRIASNAEIQAFQSQFKDPELTAREKSDLGIAFITNFGVENESRIMRNLMNQGVLSLADAWVIANPGNVAGFDIEAANRPDVVKELKANIGTTTYKEIMAEVMAQNAEYSGSIIGGTTDSVVSRGATGSRTLHVTAMNTLIQNTAAYYMNTGETDIAKAVERAVDNVVNSQFSFTEVNGKPLRMLKGLENSSAEIGNVLNSLVSDEKSREMIVGFANIPPVSGNVDVNQKYKEDLAQGYWVTTSDHKGAYLVDQTGNMVTRRIDPGPTAISPDQAFVTVRFSDILPLIAEIEQATGTAAQKITRRNEIARRLLQ